MTGPEPEWMLVAWVRLVNARWVVTGVPRRVRAQLLLQLLRDLATARAAGARIEELTATPPAVFADSCAPGRRPHDAAIDTAGLLMVCLGTGVVASAAAWSFLVATSYVDVDRFGLDDTVFAIFLILFVVAAVLAVMVAAVRWVYRRHASATALTPRLAVTLTAGTLVGFPLASIYGASRAYSLSPDVVGGEAVIVLSFLAVATVTAQHWATATRAEVR